MAYVLTKFRTIMAEHRNPACKRKAENYFFRCEKIHALIIFSANTDHTAFYNYEYRKTEHLLILLSRLARYS